MNWFKKFLTEFQAFISRGNVLDLAVAVIIGAAFSKIVDSLVKDIVNPFVGFVVGRPDFTNLFIVLKEPENYTGPHTYEGLVKAGATVIGYGNFLTVLVQFLLLAFVVFWLIKIVTTARTKLSEQAEKLLKKEEAQQQANEAAQKAAEEAKAKAQEAATQKADETLLAVLTEIRDLLKQSEVAAPATRKRASKAVAKLAKTEEVSATPVSADGDQDTPSKVESEATPPKKKVSKSTKEKDASKEKTSAS